MGDEGKRLRKISFIFGSICLLFLLAIIAFASFEVSNLKEQINEIANRPPKIVQGINGTDGLNGRNGVDGLPGLSGENGSDGKTTVINNQTIIKESTPTPGPKGDTGPSGLAGQPGQSLELNFDPTTCMLQSKYSDDDTWNNIVKINNDNCLGEGQ